MTRHDHRYVFLDTNVLLHYAAFDIDWLALANASQVTLVLAPVVIRELDKINETGRHRRLRERAKKALQQLSEYQEQGDEIRQGVRLTLEAQEPSIDYSEHKLDKDISDDQLIASILDFQSAEGDVDVLLVSAELKFRVKCKHHGIEITSPTQDNRLPDELDEHEKRVKELEAENLRLQNRNPKLEIRFADGSKYCELVATLKRPMSEEEIEERLEQEKQKYPRVEKIDYPPGAQPIMALRIIGLTDYNEKVGRYWRDYDEFLKKLADYYAHQPPVAHLEIAISNKGTSPANDIDLTLLLKTGDQVLFVEADVLPKPPTEPTPPKLPESPTSFALPSAGYNDALNLHRRLLDSSLAASESVLSQPDVIGPEIDSEGAGVTATYWVRKIKQHTTVHLPAVAIAVNEDRAKQGFGIEYRINCDNSPEVQEERLDVKFRIQSA